jgi:hypothetical protein
MIFFQSELDTCQQNIGHLTNYGQTLIFGLFGHFHMEVFQK